ncbi:hypothetical protein MRX96_045270 [Rhipicephalus microplus]|uniref:MADF domain-containing protein n=1 Tax=Rhipicephalus microplus TaxID=6941 RepID=A0A9J6EUD8_RHIMP|nr:hypothetical protein HPB51_020247 [Rhipicephalus microplus]
MDDAFIDNEILIAAVQHRLALWMASHWQHKDKIVKAAMWREVAAPVLPNVNIDDTAELVQKHWKSLRDKFRRLFVANKKAKSGAGLDDVKCITITWPYFQLLYFRKDTMETMAHVDQVRPRDSSTPVKKEPCETPMAMEQLPLSSSGIQSTSSEALQAGLSEPGEEASGGGIEPASPRSTAEPIPLRRSTRARKPPDRF